jgi:hypothetical protein
MHLVVFDIDETLIDTGTVDMECFWQAAKEIFRLPSNYPTWVEGLKHVTGLCILSQLCEQALAKNHRVRAGSVQSPVCGDTGSGCPEERELHPHNAWCF